MPSSTLSPSPLTCHPTKPTHHRTLSQSHIVIPSIKDTTTRLQCISNYKLRLESDRNEPRLRHLLGHISIYDNVREYRKEQLSQTTCPTPVYPETGVMAETVHFPQPQPQPRPQRLPRETTRTYATTREATNELQEYLSLSQVRVPSFQDFQAAIEMQLATLSEIQSASKRLQRAQTLEFSRGCPTIDEESDCEAMEVDVEEYCESESDDSFSDYDSYDGEGGWRDAESEDGEDGDAESMTDPESVRSECSSPVEVKDEDDEDQPGYFGLMPLTPLVAGVPV